MEQRVRDLIYELRHFDPDIRVSEKTTLNFKYDGHATRLVVECDNTDYEAKIAELHDANAALEGETERLEDEMDDQVKIIDDLEEKVSNLEDNLKGCRQSLDVIRGAL